MSCSAGPRTRLIALFLRREIGVEGGNTGRLLHFAPEPGLIKMLSALSSVDYVPGDLSPDNGHYQVDATRIHLSPGFDGVITSHVLEHIPDDAAAMSEMHRVLKPGGWALVLTPVHYPLAETWQDDAVKSSWERAHYYGQHDHVRIYGRDFSDRLRAAGLLVEERRYAQELGPEERTRFGVAVDETIYLCRKPIASG